MIAVKESGFDYAFGMVNPSCFKFQMKANESIVCQEIMGLENEEIVVIIDIVYRANLTWATVNS